VKILVPVDGSECSLQALDVAVDFAQTLHADIVIGHVVNLAEVAILSGGEAQLLPGCLEQEEAKGKTIVAEAIARTGNRVAVSSRTGEGEPVEEIDRIAADVDPAIIVIGSHGRSGIGRALMGSVAEGVMRVAACPVMIVPSKHAKVA
jgi:nucleotide-binding universal stress UspA family protein